LRARGQDPDGTLAKTLKEESEQRMAAEEAKRARIKGTIDLKEDVENEEKEADLAFLEQLRSLNNEMKIEFNNNDNTANDVEATVKSELQEYKIPIPFWSVKVTQEMIYSIDIHPSPTKLLAVAGEKKGFLALWDMSDTLEKCQVSQE